MITLKDTELPPENYVKYINDGNGTIDYYFDDDIEIINKRIGKARSNCCINILHKYDELEKKLSVDKNTFRDLQALAVSGFTLKGKSIAETKQIFKDAVETRRLIQDKRDDLLEALSAAKTVEEIDAIVWGDK